LNNPAKAAGSTGGILAMIIAVPFYAFIKIVGEEFFSQFRVFKQGKKETTSSEAMGEAPYPK
jgi:predicted PurR-regulated permease PerM